MTDRRSGNAPAQEALVISRRLARELTDEILVEVCQQFRDRARAEDIARRVTERLGWHAPDRVNRQEVYPMLREAAQRQILSIRPPRHVALKGALADAYHIRASERITVVSARGPTALDHVAAEAAQITLQLIKETAKTKRAVHLGLGAGRTTRSVVQHLVALLRAEEAIPPLVLHALSAGFQGDQPSVAPVAFFGLFDMLAAPEISYVGLFAPSVVRASDYARVRRQSGVEEALAQATDIDMVVTSLAAAADDHGTLNRYLQKSDRDLTLLRNRGWVGDLQYRPYSKDSPIVREARIRAVTLFELSDLVDLVHRRHGKVIVLAGPCGQCGQTRTSAVYPLLTSKKLAVWSHIVTDLQTAEELVALGRHR